MKAFNLNELYQPSNLFIACASVFVILCLIKVGIIVLAQGQTVVRLYLELDSQLCDFYLQSKHHQLA